MTRHEPQPADELARSGEQLIAQGGAMIAKAIALGARWPIERDRAVSRSIFRGSPHERAQALYASRRVRDGIFPAHLFGEPAWDILLDLCIAYHDGKSLSVKTVCIGSQAPGTTALRYINQLVECGLVERKGDTTDHRRVFLHLSATGCERMMRLLAMTEAASPTPGIERPNLRLASGVELSRAKA